jgi:hypothetical protein
VIDYFIDAGLGWNNPTLEAILLIREKPFEYKATTETLILVSLGSGGSMMHKHSNTNKDKIDAIMKAAQESRSTAEDVYRQCRYIDKVYYCRIDPDAFGRDEDDDAAALNYILNEMANWFKGEEYIKLEILAKNLLDAKTEVIVQVSLLYSHTMILLVCIKLLQ